MKKKFSLIELLIVISVISILISLLLPALAKARDKGYTVKCLGNMRQIISAQQQYSSDFADFMIVQAEENTANVPWTTMFLRLDYLKLHTMNCPKIQNPITDAIRYSSKNSSAQYYYSYGFHNQWNLSGAAFTAANGAFLHQDSPSLLYRVNRMKRPSLTWLGTDTVNADAGEWYGYGRYTWGNEHRDRRQDRTPSPFPLSRRSGGRTHADSFAQTMAGSRNQLPDPAIFLHGSSGALPLIHNNLQRRNST